MKYTKNIFLFSLFSLPLNTACYNQDTQLYDQPEEAAQEECIPETNDQLPISHEEFDKLLPHQKSFLEIILQYGIQDLRGFDFLASGERETVKAFIGTKLETFVLSHVILPDDYKTHG